MIRREREREGIKSLLQSLANQISSTINVLVPTSYLRALSAGGCILFKTKVAGADARVLRIYISYLTSVVVAGSST